jgi:hypothetical protein
MVITEEYALRAFAKLINANNSDDLSGILAKNFVYQSQKMLTKVTTKPGFLYYMNGQLEKSKQSGSAVFAEMGTISSYIVKRHCVIMAKVNKDNLVAIVLATVTKTKLSRLDLCFIPSPDLAIRSGDYPV